ncbi:hypothetical protein MPTK1_5g20520 [Marchantia polymorpha subsp. ruderalis]|uniref:Uncharacterized protein n=2 Tax=Marchantia polymorpha TaxID=3197 RepID=A0AAF6BKF3_MARPO|nr:hypothetical protein MARPO_0058s0030 [Marchantia polymorpha]BBN12487.1 hypothetical protein Mp_5g20520 [Marchantia polymorpha subsp. ruderalis]|eukprot:PTQ37240.1 hypothetical protein MARPO_0058s0030 [Marchantia polymorpha]
MYSVVLSGSTFFLFAICKNIQDGEATMKKLSDIETTELEGHTTLQLCSSSYENEL